jgi:hypothetical protein
MKTQYFTKVENKIVFNVALIFWHLFIALAILSIIIGIAIFGWSLIPTSKRKVEKKEYPAMPKLPAPVKVSFDELNLKDVKQTEVLPVVEQPGKEALVNAENNEGKKEYEASLNILKKLIPPSKYTWSGDGYFIYPYGERYWDVYKQEKYRQWVSTESGVEDKLKYSYKASNAESYNEKKQLLDAYIEVVQLLPEDKRLTGLSFLMENIAKDIAQNLNVFGKIAKMATKMPNGESINYVEQLAFFGKNNPSDGPVFIEYLSGVIEKFTNSKKAEMINGLINSYYNYFAGNLNKQIEATDLFFPMIPQIKEGDEIKSLNQYYNLYLSKNYNRDQEIAQIESEYQEKITEIDNQFNLSETNAIIEYQAKILAKQELRLKSLLGIGICILVIVMIGTILVFLSIQRSVSKIEEKMTFQKNI